MEQARLAGSDDLPRLETLLELAIEATGSYRGASMFRHPQRASKALSRLEDALENADSLLLAGTVDTYIVGLAIVTIDHRGARGRTGIVEELFVEEAARSVGIGEALLDTAFEWCRDHDCVGVDIAALPGDRGAKNLCERSGFSARMLIMHRRIH